MLAWLCYRLVCVLVGGFICRGFRVVVWLMDFALLWDFTLILLACAFGGMVVCIILCGFVFLSRYLF